MKRRSTGAPGRFGITVALSLSVAAFQPAGPAGAIELREVPLPGDAQLQLIGNDIVQNGQRVSIASFTSADSVDGVLAWYRDLWRAMEDGPGHVEAKLGDWRLISRLQDEFSIVLQLQPAASNGVRGLLSVLDLGTPGIAMNAPLMPVGATLLSDTTASDGARQSRTFLVEAVGRAGTVAAFYRDRLRRDGWQVTVDDGDASPAVLLFTSPDGRAELTVDDRRQGTTFVVLNVVTRVQ